MSKVEYAFVGNRLSALAMFLGVILTLIFYDILPIWSLYIFMAIGFIFGLIFARRVKMIQMPQMVALLNGLGGAASAIVGVFAFMEIGAGSDTFSRVTSMTAIAIGMITLLGSIVAALKLHNLMSQKPVVLPLHQFWSVLLLIATIVIVILSGIKSIEYDTLLLILGIIIPTLFGIVFSIRVGGADMPITISLLNSLSGVAGAISGLAINDVLLVAVGGVVGASGLLLTQIMCRAMNRSLMGILLGKTTAKSSQKAEVVVQREDSKISPLELLKLAKSVIIVPGYGMALAQAQHLVKMLADKLNQNGATVKYAVHPVAGRMPGHMNVLLSEADVDYDDLYEMDDINKEFKNTDLTIVIGANDVLNPAARNAQGTPIYGMPILNVDESKNIIIFNYDLKPGYAGVNNPLYSKEGVILVLGNAFDTLTRVLENI
jgi:NAD(P) transhydrogenase subunit beta